VILVDHIDLGEAGIYNIDITIKVIAKIKKTVRYLTEQLQGPIRSHVVEHYGQPKVIPARRSSCKKI